MEEGGWGFNALNFDEFEPNIDDSEDFKLTTSENSKRFGSPLSAKAIDRAIADRVPEKTRKTTQWAMSVFRSWCDARSINEPTEKLSSDMLADLLRRFVMEARRQDETPYPPATLMQIVAGIQRYFRENGQPSLTVFGDKDPRFARTRGSLDARMKTLTKEGVGTESKQAQPLTKEQEEKLWSLSIFSLNTGWGLTYIVFWYNCKLFGLRGGDEHRSLVREQFEIDYDQQGRFLRFKGRNSKNVQGGIKQRKVRFKDLKIYARQDLGERCIVDVYNHYFGFIPQTGPFYRKPTGDDPPKYSKQVIGKNKLGGLVKEMCSRAGFTGCYTNHSGKVTCAIELFAHNVDEQLIMRQTGHRSSAVRAYKRPGVAHDALVSAILQPPAPKQAKSVDKLDVPPPKCKPLCECQEPPPQGVAAVESRSNEPSVESKLSECWKSPPQGAVDFKREMPPVASKENYAPPTFQLPVVLNFNFGRC